MTAQEKIDKILETVRAGKTVYITTYTRSTKIDQKALNRFEKAGAVLLKAHGDSMYMAAGKKFVCIDYCAITTEA